MHRGTLPASSAPASGTDSSPGSPAQHAAGPAGAEGRRPGRPRSQTAERAIIDATLDLCAESGPEGLCIEKVAARAGVGKATIYRRWPGKEDLLLDAVASLKPPLPTPAGVSVADDLVTLLRAMCEQAADPRYARHATLLLGAGDRYPRLLARYRESVVEPRRDVIRRVLARGAQTGELRADVDTDAALAMLTGAVFARAAQGVAAPADYPERIVTELLRGLRSR